MSVNRSAGPAERGRMIGPGSGGRLPSRPERCTATGISILRKGSFPVSALILLTALSCRGDPASDLNSAIHRDSANVAIIENHMEDRPFDGRIVRMADLATPDDALSPRPWGVVAHRATQRVFVADAAGGRIAVFDANGAFLSELGRFGEGPGEFLLPGALAIEACDDESCRGLAGRAEVVVALDPRRAVLSRWSADGEFLGEERMPADYRGFAFALGPGHFTSIASSGNAGTVVEQRLEVQGAAGRQVIHEVTQEMTLASLPCGTLPAPRVLSPDLVWTPADREFHYLHGLGYRIDTWSDGALRRSVRRPVAPIAATREMAVAATRIDSGPYGAFMRQCNVTAEELVAAVGHAEELAPVIGLAVDPGGRVWVARRIGGLLPEAIDILDAGGEYLGTAMADALPVAFLSESRFVGLRLESSTGTLRASVHEIRDEPLSAGIQARADGAGQAARPRAVEGSEEVVEPTPTGSPESPNPAGLREFRDCPFCPLMVELPSGRFLMGRAEGEEERAGLSRDPNRPQLARDSEMPRLEVEIAQPFALGKYEVTFEEWEQCVAAGGCTHQPTDRGFGRGNRPVIHVSRLDAEEFLAWLRDLTGQAYRLPSSAEWEYAARARTNTARWWGDELGAGRAVCNGCGSAWDDRSTAPVGSFPPNPWGLHDMLSNVSEVVADCWHDTHVGHPTDGSPRLEAPAGWPDGECARATWRGGGWSHYTWTVRAATRTGGNMGLDYRADHPVAGGSRGFRVARTVDHR